MCVETLLILHLHKVFGLFPNCQGINGVLQWDPALLGCNYFHRRFCTAFGGALWIIIINRMKLLLSKLLSKVIWFPLLVYSVARGIKWYPVDFQAAHAGWWEVCWAGLLSLWQVQKGCRWQRTIPLSQKQSSCMGHGGFCVSWLRMEVLAAVVLPKPGFGSALQTHSACPWFYGNLHLVYITCFSGGEGQQTSILEYLPRIFPLVYYKSLYGCDTSRS